MSWLDFPSRFGIKFLIRFGIKCPKYYSAPKAERRTGGYKGRGEVNVH